MPPRYANKKATHAGGFLVSTSAHRSDEDDG